jgi:DNA polymerase-3 subunit delta'
VRVTVSEAVAVAEGLPVDVDEKRKPSRQIRIDEVRALIDWVVTTSGRGRGKVVVIHPAEAMNVAAAGALLKTLEEPPPGVRLLLTTSDPALLLPTIRSRCQQQALPPVPRAIALAWLAQQDVPAPEVLLNASGGQPLAALQWHRDGLTAQRWSELPAAVARGDATVLADWGVPRSVDALQKLCHDAAVSACGGMPRFFPVARLMPGARLGAVMAWYKHLQGVMRHAEHPWNEALLLEALVAEGQQAWT